MDYNFDDDDSFENKNSNTKKDSEDIDINTKLDDIKIKNKIRRPVLKLDAAKLIDDPKGIRELYSIVKYNASFNTDGEGHEYSNLKKLIFMYQSWHNNLIPSYKFEFFIDRLKSLSKESRVTSTLKDLRNLHKGVISSKDYDFDKNGTAKDDRQKGEEDEYLPPLNYEDSNEEEYNPAAIAKNISQKISTRNKQELKANKENENKDYGEEDFYEYIEAEKLSKAKQENSQKHKQVVL